MIKNYIHRLLKLLYLPVKGLMPYQIFAYLAVGAANTFLNIGLFIVLYSALSGAVLSLEISTVISFIITVLTGFWLNKNFAFSGSDTDRIDLKKQFAKYMIVALQGQVSAYLLTKGMIVLFSLNASYAYVITTIIMLTVNYFLQKYFTFRVKKLTV